MNPLVLVGLNPQPLPPFVGWEQFLNLDNTVTPMVLNSNAGAMFSLYWGMSLPSGGPLTFHFPQSAPSVEGLFSFNATDALGNIFDVSLIIGPGPFDPTSWVMLTPPQSLPSKDFAAFAVQFADPSQVTFSMTVNGTPMNFALASVPEPSTSLLMGIVLVGLLVAGRRVAGGCGANGNNGVPGFLEFSV